MSFKYSAFTENTPEMREWLEGIGIGIRPKIELAAHYQDELIIAKNGYYRELPESIVLLYESDAIDCRNNPELFKAVTVIRDDNDKGKHFIDSRGRFVECKRKTILDLRIWRISQAMMYQTLEKPPSKNYKDILK